MLGGWPHGRRGTGSLNAPNNLVNDVRRIQLENRKTFGTQSRGPRSGDGACIGILNPAGMVKRHGKIIDRIVPVGFMGKASTTPSHAGRQSLPFEPRPYPQAVPPITGNARKRYGST